jgi:phosphatidate cytidylyltransferase
MSEPESTSADRSGASSRRKAILMRTVLGAILIAGVCGVLWLDASWIAPVSGGVEGAVLAGLIVVLAVLGFREMGRLFGAAGTGLLGFSGLAGTILLATMPAWGQIHPGALMIEAVLALLGVVAAAVFVEQMARYRVEGALARVAGTLLAVLYLGVGLAVLLAVRVERGTGVLVLFLAVVKFTDIGAYFTGTAIGRHKLIPWLSPGKSWEGLAGGLALGAAAAVVVTWAFREHEDLWAADLSWAGAVAFGVVVGLAGQLGDLCESLLKRAAQVKDSGAALPEFGGVLDLLDSPLLAAPVAYLLLKLLG